MQKLPFLSFLIKICMQPTSATTIIPLRKSKSLESATNSPSPDFVFPPLDAKHISIKARIMTECVIKPTNHPSGTKYLSGHIVSFHCFLERLSQCIIAILFASKLVPSTMSDPICDYVCRVDDDSDAYQLLFALYPWGTKCPRMHAHELPGVDVTPSGHELGDHLTSAIVSETILPQVAITE